MKKLKVGTRKSPLAMRQTELIRQLLQEKQPELEIEVVGLSTKGDRDQQSHLTTIGGKGVFAKEVELALLAGEVDFAVHSLKDLSALLPNGLTLAAYPKRATALDVVVYANEKRLSDDGHLRLGTGSIRRIKQLQLAYPQVETLPIRGKIETRLEKMKTEQLDGLVLAAAGLERMGYLDELTYELLPVDKLVPAVGQGILGVECRENDTEIYALLQEISDSETETAALAERKFLALMDGNCEVPLGALAQKVADDWTFDAFLAHSATDSGRRVRLVGKNPDELVLAAFEALQP